jgi:hypothetical protein
MSLVSIGTSPRLGIESGQILSDSLCLFAVKLATKMLKIHKESVETRAVRVECSHPLSDLALCLFAAIILPATRYQIFATLFEKLKCGSSENLKT